MISTDAPGGAPISCRCAPPPWSRRARRIDYTVSLEPHQHRWIFALDWPSRWDLPGALLTGDYTLVQRDPVSRPHRRRRHLVHARAILEAAEHVLRAGAIPGCRPIAIRVRCNWRKRSRGMHPDDGEYVQAVLAMFTQQPFYYTLTPPKLADDSVDAFLFETKRGFCEHYASAFAVADARRGHSGACRDRLSRRHLQSITRTIGSCGRAMRTPGTRCGSRGRGWLRVDPTSAIAPERVERDAEDAVIADEPLTGRWQRRIPLVRRYSAAARRDRRCGASASCSSIRARSSGCSNG